MPLTDSQKLAIKKHLGEQPLSIVLDANIKALEDGGAKESELTTALTACDTALTAVATTETDADEIAEGGGAKFSYERRLAIKKQSYRRNVENLARILAWLPPRMGGLTGVINL